MHIKREIKDSAVILSVEGDVNILSAPDLLKGMVAAIERKPQRLLLNLAAVPYMDSSGVGVLVNGMKQASGSNIRFGLYQVDERVMAIFELTRLSKIFKVFPDEATALRDL